MNYTEFKFCTLENLGDRRNLLCDIFFSLAIKKLSSLFLLQYICGGELEGLFLDYSIHLEWSTRLYLAKDIAEEMRYLHKQGVIHRDLTSKVL